MERWDVPECFRGQLLRLLDAACRLEERVKASRGGGCLGQENVLAIEREHVLRPMRMRQRGTPRNRQRVEDSRGMFCIGLECHEEGSDKASLHPLHDAQMKFLEEKKKIFNYLSNKGKRGNSYYLNVSLLIVEDATEG